MHGLWSLRPLSETTEKSKMSLGHLVPFSKKAFWIYGGPVKTSQQLAEGISLPEDVTKRLTIKTHQINKNPCLYNDKEKDREKIISHYLKRLLHNSFL